MIFKKKVIFSELPVFVSTLLISSINNNPVLLCRLVLFSFSLTSAQPLTQWTTTSSKGTPHILHIKVCVMPLELVSAGAEDYNLASALPLITPLHTLLSSLSAYLIMFPTEACSFDVEVTEVLQSCFVQLRHLTKIRSFLSFADHEKVIRAFCSN